MPTPLDVEGLERAMNGAGHGSLGHAVVVYRRWLHLPDPGVLYAAWATVVANRAEGDPLWLLVVGPPSGGKTEAIAPLSALTESRMVATITEAGLLSGTPHKQRADGAKGGLLREIGEQGLLILKDFTSVLSMNRDARASLLAALREVYDGSWTRTLGADGGRSIEWTGKLGLLGAVTYAIDSHHAVIATMGDRFALYRLPVTEEHEQAMRAMQHVGSERQMRTELADAAVAVIDAANLSLLSVAPAEEMMHRLADLASLVVRGRSAVERDPYTREITQVPPPEAPARLVRMLLRLHQGLLAIGCDAPLAWQITVKVAMDSMPDLRRRTLEYLVPKLGAGGVSTTTNVAEVLDLPTTTTLRVLEDLGAHGLLRRTSQGQGKADLWNVTRWTLDRWSATSPETSDVSTSAGSSLTSPIHIEEDFSGEVPANGTAHASMSCAEDLDGLW